MKILIRLPLIFAVIPLAAVNALSQTSKANGVAASERLEAEKAWEALIKAKGRINFIPLPNS